MIKKIDNPLEKHLAVFAADKSKDNYVRLLYAFRYTDVLVPAAVRNDPELPFGNDGVLKPSVFKPDINPLIQFFTFSVKNDDQFTHDGDESDHFLFTVFQQFFIEAFHFFIPFDCG